MTISLYSPPTVLSITLWNSASHSVPQAMVELGVREYSKNKNTLLVVLKTLEVGQAVHAAREPNEERALSS
jgi:hypothetical protein